VIGEEEVVDVISTIDWVTKLSEAQEQPVIVFGMDHGVYLALAAVQTRSEIVDGVIAAYGYSDIAAQYHFLAENDKRGAENFLDDTGCAEETAVELCLENRSISPLTIAVPMLLIHSRADSVVPIAQTEQIVADATEPARVTTLYEEDPSVDHFYLNNEGEAGFDAAETAIHDWLDIQL
jgi:dipeptidyl aminopeptidase/acylaminoacyl peptidase